MSTIYQHQVHPYVEERRQRRPVKVDEQRPTATAFQRFNSWLGLRITVIVGTMVCAYVFTAIALVSLPSALSSRNLTIIIAWLSSNFLQLVLLPIIIVGQNIQAQASDKRADATYHDASAILHEAMEIQRHLEAQDQAIERILDSVSPSPPPPPGQAAPEPQEGGGPPGDGPPGQGPAGNGSGGEGR
ncbi:MAG TPA: hypothetical protein VKW77_02805 [Acidimicrobiales bacterium]|nr:hypothetical protein [Acidimicrobiales bacterium]